MICFIFSSKECWIRSCRIFRNLRSPEIKFLNTFVPRSSVSEHLLFFLLLRNCTVLTDPYHCCNRRLPCSYTGGESQTFSPKSGGIVTTPCQSHASSHAQAMPPISVIRWAADFPTLDLYLSLSYCLPHECVPLSALQCPGWPPFGASSYKFLGARHRFVRLEWVSSTANERKRSKLIFALYCSIFVCVR